MPPPALPPQQPVLLPGPAIPPPTVPPPLQHPNPRNPPRRQQRRNAALDTESDIPDLPEDLEGDVGNGRDCDSCKVGSLKEFTSTDMIQCNRRSNGLKNALLVVPRRNAAGNDCSSECSGSRGESEYSRCPVRSDTRDDESLLGAPARDSGRRGRRNLGRNPGGTCGRRSATCTANVDGKVHRYRCQGQGRLLPDCPGLPPSPGQIACQATVARRSDQDAISTSATQAHAKAQPPKQSLHQHPLQTLSITG